MTIIKSGSGIELAFCKSLTTADSKQEFWKLNLFYNGFEAVSLLTYAQKKNKVYFSANTLILLKSMIIYF